MSGAADDERDDVALHVAVLQVLDSLPKPETTKPTPLTSTRSMKKASTAFHRRTRLADRADDEEVVDLVDVVLVEDQLVEARRSAATKRFTDAAETPSA